MRVASQYVTVPPHDYAAARFHVAQGYLLNLHQWNTGGLVEVENTLASSDVMVYVDAVSRYRFLPEVWSPGSASRLTKDYPALEMEISMPYKYVGDTVPLTPFKASLIVQPGGVEEGQTIRLLVVDAKLFRNDAYRGSIGVVRLKVALPAQLGAGDKPYASFKSDKKYGGLTEKLLGVSQRLHWLVSTIATIADLLGVKLPSKANAFILPVA